MRKKTGDQPCTASKYIDFIGFFKYNGSVDFRKSIHLTKKQLMGVPPAAPFLTKTGVIPCLI